MTGKHDRRATWIAVGALVVSALSCASRPEDQGSGIEGFEPSITASQFGAERYFVLDSNDVAIISGDRFLLAPTFLLLDRAALDYRRYMQELPRRTAVALVTEPGDSAAIDSLARAARAPLIIWERVNLPRDNRGQPLPISRFLIASITTSVARAWLLTSDTTARGKPFPDWILAGTTQLVTGYPRSVDRAAQLGSQLTDLVPLDTLVRMTIPESAVRSGVGVESGLGAEQRPPGFPAPRPQTGQRRLPRDQLAALQAASVLEFMWAREGRGIIKRLVDASRRGEPLSSVLAQAASLPRDVAGLEAAWKESITPKKR